MAQIIESIDVDVPVTTAYNQWTQFESFPHFLQEVESITQLDDSHVLVALDGTGNNNITLLVESGDVIDASDLVFL